MGTVIELVLRHCEQKIVKRGKSGATGSSDNTSDGAKWELRRTQAVGSLLV